MLSRGSRPFGCERKWKQSLPGSYHSGAIKSERAKLRAHNLSRVVPKVSTLCHHRPD